MNDHIIYHCGKQSLLCQCGAAELIAMPIKLEELWQQSDAFTAKHRDCALNRKEMAMALHAANSELGAIMDELQTREGERAIDAVRRVKAELERLKKRLT